LILVITAQRSSLAATEPELPNPGSVGGIDKQQQIQVGLQAMAEVYQQMPVLPDSNPLSQFVQGLGKKLAQVIPQEYSWPYQFHVIPQKEINAFALPGGPMFINVGTITAADNEAELVGVMAHEMSHVYMQHSAKQMAKGTLAQGIAGVLGGILGSRGGTLGTLAQLGVNVGAGMVMLKYSRADEAQADAVGAIIMYKAGYNPQAMADFFTKLEKEGGANGPQFFSDHPNPGNRAGAVEREVRSLPTKAYRSGSPEFAQIKQRVAGLKPLTAQEIAAQQQAQSQSVKGRLPATEYPSRDTQIFTHDLFEVSYPKNWQVFGDRTSTVNIAPPSGVSDNAIAYGVLISDYQPEDNNATVDQSTHALLNTLRQSNQDMKQVGNDENIRVAGVTGKSVDLIAASPVQDATGRAQRERDWLVTVPGRRGNLIYLVFIAPDADFNTLRPTFDQMLRSLRVK